MLWHFVTVEIQEEMCYEMTYELGFEALALTRSNIELHCFWTFW